VLYCLIVQTTSLFKCRVLELVIPLATVDDFITLNGMQQDWVIWAVFSFFFIYSSAFLSNFNRNVWLFHGEHRVFSHYLFCFAKFVLFCDISTASSWCHSCLMYDLDIKSPCRPRKTVNHCLRNKVKRIRTMWGRKDANTIMIKAVGFHFILSCHVKVYFENEIWGAAWRRTICLCTCHARKQFVMGNPVYKHLLSPMNP